MWVFIKKPFTVYDKTSVLHNLCKRTNSFTYLKYAPVVILFKITI